MIVKIPAPALVVLCGPAGSGKSTFAHRRFPDTSIVSSDRCRAMIADDEANIRVSREAFELFHQIIALRLQHRRLTVADSTAVRPEARQALLQIGRQRNVPMVAILFDVAEATCLRRDEGRPRRVGRAVIHRQWISFQQALPRVTSEGFAQVVVLGEDDLRRVQVEILGASGRRGAAATL
ncbi:MAG TPA: AAA family ATPase [bacterium]|nr:AAA family ATPase [bacterium]